MFTTGDGGWIYVSNSETLAPVGGGASAVRFDGNGDIVDAYRIVDGTNLNCAGGDTPWGTWLSCEETPTGRVWECDPLGESAAVARPAMGAFEHEAAAVDEANRHVYLTEDVGDGRLYRFVYENAEDLGTGELQVAEVLGSGPEGAVEWRTVPDPSGGTEETRYQVPSSTPFNGGEGIWIHGRIYFTTKGDNRVWVYDTATSMLTILYDVATSSTPILSGVDNLTVTPAGDVVVGEDGGDMEIVAVAAEGSVVSLVQVTGQELGSHGTYFRPVAPAALFQLPARPRRARPPRQERHHLRGERSVLHLSPNRYAKTRTTSANVPSAAPANDVASTTALPRSRRRSHRRIGQMQTTTASCPSSTPTLKPNSA